MTTTAKDLAGASTQETQEFLDSFDVVLSDCDGVLWDFVAEIDGSVKSLKKLQDLGKRVYFVTNNSVATVENYCSKIRDLGLDAEPEQIINTATVVTSYLKKTNFEGEIFTIASTPFRETLKKAGFKLAEPPAVDSEMDVAAALRAIQDRKLIKAVIMDADIDCNWAKMALAISCLKRDDCLYFCGAVDEWVIYDSNVKVLGPGPLIDVISKQSGRTPTKCGKPSEVLRDFIFDMVKLQDPSRCLFIGDTVNQDMKFGTLCGFQKLFVDSGCDRLKETLKSEDVRPTYYLPSLGHLNPLLDSLKSSSVNGV